MLFRSAAYGPASGDALRESHPSEDLSELPPLFAAVAGQGYHYRLTGSWRSSLPGLPWTGWTRWAPCLPSLMLNFSRTGGLRAPSPSLPPSSGDRQLMLIRCRLFRFQGAGKPLPFPSQKLPGRANWMRIEFMTFRSSSSSVTLSFNSSVVCSEDKNFRSGWNQPATRIPP